ncbi:MAG TPA: hypothetical protein VHA52_11905, partial [Candidatus Babeliaceae bacterium]|nr:hypothetical protein [Candidatus Babeliaceae bacterium]
MTNSIGLRDIFTFQGITYHAEIHLQHGVYDPKMHNLYKEAILQILASHEGVQELGFLKEINNEETIFENSSVKHSKENQLLWDRLRERFWRPEFYLASSPVVKTIPMVAPEPEKELTREQH